MSIFLDPDDVAIHDMTAIQKIINHDRITADVAADFLGVSKQTLAIWRCTKRHTIPFYKIGKNVFYKITDLEAFVESNRISE